MKLKKRYLLLLIAISLFLVDFGLTWYFLNYTAYAEEGNPLFAIDGGYLSLIINLIYVVTVFIIGYKIEKYQTIIIEANSSFDYFKKLYKTNHYDFIIISVLTSFIYSSFVSRLVAIIEWIVYGIYQSDFYDTKYAIIKAKMPFGRYDILFIFIAFFIFIFIWFKSEYNKSNKLLKV